MTLVAFAIASTPDTARTIPTKPFQFCPNPPVSGLTLCQASPRCGTVKSPRIRRRLLPEQRLQQATIKQDQEIKHKTFSQTSPEREWSGRFTAPVDAPVSDVFGTRRVFNGATKSVHQGLDYRVPSATPVNAINSGTVILAQPLYFEGNCVTIDHGQGLLSLYLHLSALKVKEGDKVERNQEIGLSGATGRATGPHLHIAVRWQGVYLDPAALLTLNLPGK